MRASRTSILFPILVITVGTGWLLTSRQILPGVNWVWVLALGVLGLASLASGVNKFTLVIGLFLVLCSIASLLRQSGRLDIDTEIPALTIAFGVLMLIARLAPIPWPVWMDDRTPDGRGAARQ